MGSSIDFAGPEVGGIDGVGCVLGLGVGGKIGSTMVLTLGGGVDFTGVGVE